MSSPDVNQVIGCSLSIAFFNSGCIVILSNEIVSLIFPHAQRNVVFPHENERISPLHRQ